MICVVLESRINPSYEQFLSSQAERLSLGFWASRRVGEVISTCFQLL